MTISFGDERLPARFWAKVRISHYPCQRPEVDTRCWIWIGSLNASGYGMLHWEKKSVLSHRLAYLSLVSPIPEGLQCDHQCWCRYCCNPNHIRLATPQQNSDNISQIGRERHRVSSCRSGKLGGRLRSGEAHGRAKLVERDVLEIRRLYVNGLSYQELSVQFYVSQSQISRIVKREQWDHI